MSRSQEARGEGPRKRQPAPRATCGREMAGVTDGTGHFSPLGSREAGCPSAPIRPGEGEGHGRASLHRRPPSRPRHLCPPGSVQLEAGAREQLHTMNKMAPSPRRERSSASVAGRGLISNPYCLGMGPRQRQNPTENKYLSTLTNALATIGGDWPRG